MAKRQSLLANIDMEVEQTTSDVVEIPIKTAPAIPPKKNVKTSLYLPSTAHRKLKEIAFAKDCKVHDLVIEGIDKVLIENGFSRVKDFS